MFIQLTRFQSISVTQAKMLPVDVNMDNVAMFEQASDYWNERIDAVFPPTCITFIASEKEFDRNWIIVVESPEQVRQLIKEQR